MDFGNSDLPGLFQAADHTSTVAQRRFLFASRGRLILLICAAITGTVAFRTGRGFDLAAVGTVVTLFGAVLVESWLAAERLEETWYDGRAVAESVKTMAWRFAVGGAPFAVAGGEDVARQLFSERFDILLRDLPETSLEPSEAPAITDRMRALRARPLPVRQAVYQRCRIVDQRRWYSGESTWNRRRARFWQLVLVTSETLGLLAALTRALGLITVDLAGIVAAVAGAVVAWLSLKQHRALSRAYAVAAHELALVEAQLADVEDEDEWAVRVTDADEAISREHTMWRASRSGVH